MPPDMKTQFIEHFLVELKIAISENRFNLRHDRPDMKNRDTLYLLDYTIEDAVIEFSKLCRTDYLSGPVADKEYPADRELWEFKRVVSGYLIYFKVMKVSPAGWFIGISFHVDE